MVIFRALQTDRITQGWGENLVCVSNCDPLDVIETKDFCPLGYQSLYASYGMRGHNGVDWAGYYNEPLYFPVVADTEWWSRSESDKNGGIGVDIFSTTRVKLDKLPAESGKMARKEWEDNDGKVYIKFRFWHMNRVGVEDARREEGDYHPRPNVKFGDVVGYTGSTGQSSGNHLHLAMKIVAKNSMTIDADNGYFGAVDHTRWTTNIFAKTKQKEEIKKLQLTVITLANQVIELLQKIISLKK